MKFVNRSIGLETEWGIIAADNFSADPLQLSADFVSAYASAGSASVANKLAAPDFSPALYANAAVQDYARIHSQQKIRWDYTGEDPLNDARGYRLARQKADVSQLTDVATDVTFHAAQHTNSASQTVQELLAQLPQIRRPSRAELAAPPTNTVLTNGARLYVDHAHPEYAAPEVINPREAVLWDRAGDAIARETMEILGRAGKNYLIYKNNVDGKGAAYGTHENYLLSRKVDFTDVIRYLTPFFVTRPIICGAGRVGLGQRSQYPGFQISQRADYIENTVGLETTFNRPIINTRDEPHADARKYRRLHVIGGDANQFDYSNLLKVGTTSLVLWLLEQEEIPLELDSLLFFDAVAASWEVSHDISLQKGIDMHDGSQKTAIEIQQIYLDVIRDAIARFGEPDFDTQEILDLWQEVLDALRSDFQRAARKVEWVAKYLTLHTFRERDGLAWNDPQITALDLQWHDLRRERSIVQKLISLGQVDTLFTDAQVQWAKLNPPETTRAYLRGRAIQKFGPQIVGASWSSLIFDLPQLENLVRLELPEPFHGTKAQLEQIFTESETAAQFLARYLQLPSLMSN